jgi:hypothetical protein
MMLYFERLTMALTAPRTQWKMATRKVRLRSNALLDSVTESHQLSSREW